MKHKILIGAFFAAFLGLGLVSQPVSALDEPLLSGDAADPEDVKNLHSTFAESDSGDATTITFGKNLLIAGNSFDSDAKTSGLLLSAGNILSLKTNSEYAFVAGNSITIDSKVEKDLFVAGNIVKLSEDAEIGRDVYAAANEIVVNTDLKGDFSVGASRITFNDVTIDGNVNIDVDMVVFEGDVKIKGALTLNSDSEQRGLDNVSYTAIEWYENPETEVSTSEVVAAAIIGIACTLVAFLILLAIFPGINAKVERELTTLQFGKDLVIGICALFLIPIICIFLFITIIGSVAALALLLGYLLMLCFAQAFAGLWLGKLLVEQVAHAKMNPYLESIVGIIIIKVCVMIPFLGSYVSVISLVLGLGLIMQCLRTRISQKNNTAAEVKEAQVVQSPEKSATSDSKGSNNDKPVKTNKPPKSQKSDTEKVK